MRRIHWLVSPEMVSDCLLAVLTVAIATVILAPIGRDTFDESVVALLYLVPIAWSSARWGLVPGLCAALAAILAFDFFFTLPVYSLTVSRMESLVVLVVLSLVAVLIVASIKSGMSRTYTGERDAIFMVRTAEALADLRTQDAVVRTLASHFQQMFQASLVEVFVLPSQSSPLSARAPSDAPAHGRPDRVLPILAAPELVGEIRLWGSSGWLPPEDSYLFRNLATQVALALERARLAEVEEHRLVVAPVAGTN
jgi:two-component system sensor histidine kinase KdpD